MAFASVAWRSPWIRQRSSRQYSGSGHGRLPWIQEQRGLWGMSGSWVNSTITRVDAWYLPHCQDDLLGQYRTNTRNLGDGFLAGLFETLYPAKRCQ